MCVQRTLRRVRERFHRFTPNRALSGNLRLPCGNGNRSKRLKEKG